MRIDETVRQMHPPRYTINQAARLVGRHPDTLRRWSRLGILTASDEVAFGGISVPVYTDDDIQDMRNLRKTLKPGRKPKTE